MRWALASGNQGKIREIEAAFAPLGVQWVSQKALGLEGADETACTFVENALLKARHVAKHSGLPTLADDSGLIIDALAGRPGVFSARYGGRHGDFDGAMVRILDEMHAVPQSQRQARFIAVMVWMSGPEDATPLIAQGVWQGHIAFTRQGQGGFGYDPIFIDQGSNVAAAEMSLAQKQAVSHRGQAMADLMVQIRSQFCTKI